MTLPNGVNAVFPAPAGINRRIPYSAMSTQSVPRASGDKPQTREFLAELEKCSPRQRG
ncbi:hypothetical protein IFC76_001490 [Salmonella enterica]|nr:hypothetical protein [Salmonella enterica]EGH8215151.1 hypothetical protein [Salmonella enterica]EGM2237142.1 hypothetical protein [Salmonella enterica]